MRVKYRFRADDDSRRGGSFDDLDQEGSGREDPGGRYDDPGDERPDTDAPNADAGHGHGGHKLSEAGGKDAAGADGPDKGEADLDKIDDSYSGSQWGGSGVGSGVASEGLKDVAGEGMQHGMGAGGVAGVTGSIGAAAAGAVRVLATVLHISPRAATILATVLAVTVPVAGGVAVGAGFMSNNYNQEVFWIDEDECEDYIAQAAKDMKNADGSRTEIPETIQAGGEGGGQTYKVGYAATWENDANRIGFGGGTPNQKVVDLYNAKGGYKTPNGFDRIKGLNDIFILAIGQGPFKAEGADELNIGDLITVEFDDGTTINAIIGDHKGRYGVDNPYDKSCWNDIHTGQCRSGPDTTCGWGHVDGGEIGVLEFWGFESGGNPMTGLLQAETGGSMTRCTAITVHGMCQEFAEFAGISTSGTLVSAMNLRANSNKKASEALEECGVSKKNVEASDFASALVLSSYSQKVYWDGGKHPGTEVYDTVWNNIPSIKGYCQYRSCCATVGLAAIWSGIEFEMGGPARQGDIAEEGIATGEWERLYGKNGEDHTPPNMSMDDCIDYFGMKPGTIITTDGNGHILAYVGEEAVQNGYKNALKGTDADVGEPEEGAAFVSGSTGVSGAGSTRDSDPGNGRPSGIHDGYNTGDYRVYHYIGKYPHADETRQAADFKSIAKGGTGSNTSGTSCDCGDPCVEEFGADGSSSSSAKGGSSGKMDTGKLGENAKLMANYLKKQMGFSNAQIAAFISNALFESYGVWQQPGDPIDVNYDEFGYCEGIWGGGCFGFIEGGGLDTPDGGLIAIAASMGKEVTDPEPQLEYVKKFWGDEWMGYNGGHTVGDWVSYYGGSLQEELRTYLNVQITKDSFLSEKDPAMACLILQAGWERGPASEKVRIKQRMDCAKYIYELLGKDVKDSCADKKKKVKGLDIVVETARLFVGKPYSMANHGDYKNFNSEATDCSGLVGWAYWHALQKDTGCPACDGFAAGVLAGGSEGTCLGEFERVTKYEDLVAGDVLLHCLEPLGAGTGGGGDHAMIFVEDQGGTALVIEESSGGCTENANNRCNAGDVGESGRWNYCCHLKEEFQEGEPTPECREALRAKGFNF